MIIIKGERQHTTKIAMNVIINMEIPRNNLIKNSKILYNILWNRIYKNFLEIISRKIREYFLDLLFERKNEYSL